MAAAHEPQPYGLPTGSVRGFLSILICSFFWLILLFPGSGPPSAPLGHFFLLTLVFLAFASHPLHESGTPLLPWVMRLIFVGGSVAVVLFVMFQDSGRLAKKLTPDAGDIKQWPVLLGCLALGFGIALFSRFILGRSSAGFQTVRGWLGVLAMLLLLFETVFQFVIVPRMSDKPGVEAMQAWEGVLIAVTAAYFGTRA